MIAPKFLRSALYGIIVYGVTVCTACEQGGERPAFPDATGGLGGNESTEGQTSGGGAPVRLPGSENPQEISLPFAVDEHFVPFGYMGSPVTGYEGIPVTIFRDPNDCKERPEGAQGHCHAFRFLELPEQVWRGLYWLSDYDNWGDRPGRQIVPGARKLTFFAATDVEGLTVFFLAGGVESDPPADDSKPHYKDVMATEVEIVLSSELKEYSIPLADESYEAGVLGGFGWGVYTVKGGHLWIDNIRWE